MKWAIQDGATGEWWNGNEWSADNDEPSWCDSPAELSRSTVFDEEREFFRATVRIVPEPPPEMTNEETWAWFRGSNLYMHATGDSYFINEHKGGPTNQAYACGRSPEGAIRMARKNREAPSVCNDPQEWCANVLEMHARALDPSRSDARMVLFEMAHLIRNKGVS